MADIRMAFAEVKRKVEPPAPSQISLAFILSATFEFLPSVIGKRLIDV